MNPKTSIERKTLVRRALPCAKLRLLSIVGEIISIRLACAGVQEKRQAEGMERRSHNKCLFHVCVSDPKYY